MLLAEVDSAAMQSFDPERMRRLRKEAGLTQVQAAKLAGMSQSQWSQIESGDQRDAMVSTLAAVASAIGCEIQDLLTPAKKRRTK